MRRECWERFPRHWLQMKPLVSDPDMHLGTCVTHVPWRMSGSLTHGVGENVPGIPGACATRNFTYPARGPYQLLWQTTIDYRKIPNITRIKSQHLNDSRLCQGLNREWRCSWSSADRRCSNYIWVINDYIPYKGASLLEMWRYILTMIFHVCACVGETGFGYTPAFITHRLVSNLVSLYFDGSNGEIWWPQIAYIIWLALVSILVKTTFWIASKCQLLAVVHTTAWHEASNKPLPDQWWPSSLTQLCVSWPQGSNKGMCKKWYTYRPC